MRFIEYLNEAKVKTDPQLKRLYDKFNDEVFLRKLGTSLPEDLVIGWTSQKRSVGRAKANVNRETGDLTPRQITISKEFDLSEEQLKEIVLHEMAHIYFYTRNQNVSHGAKFRKLIDEINKITGLNVPYKESDLQMKEKESIKTVGCMLLNMRSGYRVVVFNKKYFDNNFYQIIEKYQRLGKELKEYHIGYSDDPELEKYPHKRSLPKGKIPFYEISQESYEKVLKNMKVLKSGEGRVKS